MSAVILFVDLVENFWLIIKFSEFIFNANFATFNGTLIFPALQCLLFYTLSNPSIFSHFSSIRPSFHIPPLLLHSFCVYHLLSILASIHLSISIFIPPSPSLQPSFFSFSSSFLSSLFLYFPHPSLHHFLHLFLVTLIQYLSLSLHLSLHLSNDYTLQEEENVLFSILTYVGCGISILCLLGSIFFFLSLK